MLSDINIWGGEFGPITWRKGHRDGTLTVEVGSYRSDETVSVNIFSDCEQLGELMIQLLLDPDVRSSAIEQLEGFDLLAYGGDDDAQSKVSAALAFVQQAFSASAFGRLSGAKGDSHV